MLPHLLLALLTSWPQVQLEEHPHDLQLYPRDDHDLGTLVVSGTWRETDPGQELRFEVVGAGQEMWVDAISMRTSPAGGALPFHLQVQVPAGLVDYEAFLVLREAQTDTVLESWGGIAVGDVLLIQGQSNAVAGDYWAEQLANQNDQDSWIRSYGSASTVPGDVSNDTAWHLADGESFNISGSIGAWALDIAKKIVDQEGIPVAVLNGAVGGTFIWQHQRDDLQPEDLNTIYGRLLWRARQAGVDLRARAMFYYQGESDGADALGWATGFRDLAQDWRSDFPGVEHTWVVQVRKGCGSPSLELRDFQRRVGQIHPRFHAATANGLPGHDFIQCHFFYEGYEELGRQLAPQVAHHLYSHPELPDAEAPDILSADWETSAQDAVILTFRNTTGPMSAPAGSWSSMSLSDGTQILSVTPLGPRLRVQLAGYSTGTWISFDGTSGVGTPWIVNARGHAPLSFHQVPIQ
ncbi:MAG: sialate O-acetylesterase [Planctomycetota bacterium]|jgi:hypothetical protein